MTRDIKWKIIPWREGLPSKETNKLIRILEDEGYTIEVSTDLGNLDDSTCCFEVWGEEAKK